MNSCVKRLVALSIGAAFLGPAATFAATGGEEPPIERLVQYHGRVVVGDDGNGVTFARFPTTADGPEVRYFLYIDDALGTGVKSGYQSIALNGEVVFQNDDSLPNVERVEVALNPVGGELNDIVLVARGEPGSAAAVAVVAVRPAEAAVGGQSILPWAMSDAHASTSLTVHNVGPSPLAFRIVFLNPDGSLAGRTSPHALSVGATQNLDLGQLVAGSGIQWSRGAVHVQWASHGFTRVSAAARLRRVPLAPGDLDAALALDAYGARPLNRAELGDIFGE